MSERRDDRAEDHIVGVRAREGRNKAGVEAENSSSSVNAIDESSRASVKGKAETMGGRCCGGTETTTDPRSHLERVRGDEGGLLLLDRRLDRRRSVDVVDHLFDDSHGDRGRALRSPSALTDDE